MYLYLLSSILAFSLMNGCATVYYDVWEALGQEKRDLLRSNILKTKKDHHKVEDQFEDTLAKVRATYKLKNPKLESLYDTFKEDYQLSKSKAEQLSRRIETVNNIAQDLFSEWKTESSKIKNDTYRKDSVKKRQLSMVRFGAMMKSMREVEKSLGPVLTKLNDQVLYLKHNLNASSIGAFKGELNSVETEIKNLIAEIQQSNKQADKFIAQL